MLALRPQLSLPSRSTSPQNTFPAKSVHNLWRGHLVLEFDGLEARVAQSANRTLIGVGEYSVRLLLDYSPSLTLPAGGLLFEIFEAMATWQKLGRVCIDPTHLPFGESGVAPGHGAMRIIDGARAFAHQAFLSGLELHDFPFIQKIPFRFRTSSMKSKVLL
jgi:hypothetical protein